MTVMGLCYFRLAMVLELGDIDRSSGVGTGLKRQMLVLEANCRAVDRGATAGKLHTVLCTRAGGRM